jgi:5-methylcytosine-specific restriction protein A
MDNPLCVACQSKGITREATELDHIVPLFKGGTNEAENLQGLCTECHKDKTRIDMGWRHETGLDGWPVG